MTVEELIKELQKIEDKSKMVYFEDEEWGKREVNEVILNDNSVNYNIVLISHN